MAESSYLEHRSIHGSLLCEAYELRITRRCIKHDLSRDPESSFADLSNLEIVKALVTKRSDGPTDTRQVAPLTSGRTVYRLAVGHRHRGATWHDETHDVVWLLAYHPHEFEDQGDAFPYFKGLDAKGELLPTESDYTQLFVERAKRFALTVPQQAQDLLGRARLDHGREHRAVLGGEVGAGVEVTLEVIEGGAFEDVYVAMKPPPNREAVPIVTAAFFPNATADQIEWSDQFPSRHLEADEICFRHLLEP